MKQLLIFSLLAIIIIPGHMNSFAQTKEEIISKHIEAIGGQAIIDKLESIKITGKYTAFSETKNFVTVHKKPNLFRSDYGCGQFDVIYAYDGETGWTIDPWHDITFPRVLTKSEENKIIQKADFISPFLEIKKNGHEIEYIGKEQLDGISVFVFELKRSNEKKEKWYLNAETYLPFKHESTWDDFGVPVPQETYFEDYRTIEGITIPFYTERSYLIRNRIIEIEDVKLNYPTENSFFKIPPSPEMKELENLAGKWSVIVKAQTRRGLQRVDSISARIELKHNLLETKHAYENYFRFKKRFSCSYHKEKQKYQMTIFDEFSSQLDVFEGNFSNDTLVFDKPEKLSQYKLILKDAGSFILESVNSTDEGKTWNVVEKFIFNRME